MPERKSTFWLGALALQRDRRSPPETMEWHHNRKLRLVGLVAATGWFLYWGHLAYISAKAHDQAEAARFVAESRRDWASAQMHERASAAAIQDLIRSIGWGFFIPLTLLVAGEVDAGVRRIRRRNAQKETNEGPRWIAGGPSA